MCCYLCQTIRLHIEFLELYVPNVSDVVFHLAFLCYFLIKCLLCVLCRRNARVNHIIYDEPMLIHQDTILLGACTAVLINSIKQTLQHYLETFSKHFRQCVSKTFLIDVGSYLIIKSIVANTISFDCSNNVMIFQVSFTIDDIN